MQIEELIEIHGAEKVRQVVDMVTSLDKTALNQVLYISKHEQLGSDIYQAIQGKEPQEKVAIITVMIDKHKEAAAKG